MNFNSLIGAAALALVAVAPASVFAQAQPPAPAYLPQLPPVTDAQFKLGQEIVQIAGIDKSFVPFVGDLMSELAGNLTRTRPELITDLNKVLIDVIAPEFTKRTVEMSNHASRLVATMMSEQDMRETVAFLKSPAGKKYSEIQPQVLNRLVPAIEPWNRQLSVDMMTRVRAEMKKKGHDL